MCQRATVTDNMICTWTAATGVQILLYKLPCTTPLYRQCMSQTEYDHKEQYKNVSSCRQLTACRSLAKSLWQMWCARFAAVIKTHDKHLYVYMENLRKYTKHSTCANNDGDVEGQVHITIIAETLLSRCAPASTPKDWTAGTLKF